MSIVMSKRVFSAAFVVGLILVSPYGKVSIASENASPGTQTGTKIVFASNSQGNLGLLMMRPDGTEQKQLTDGAANDREPDWSLGNFHNEFRWYGTDPTHVRHP